MPEFTNRTSFVSPITPRYREVFYSSIPVEWDDLEEGCITCLDCARDTFEPPSEVILKVDGKVVI